MSGRFITFEGIDGAGKSTHVESVAQRLHNTPAVCRKCYVHPALLSAYARGHTLPPLRPVRRAGELALQPEERAVLTFLRKLGRGRT